MSEFDSSSLRYVKSVSNNPEMAHNKILSRINDQTSVLEVGCASGSMTRVLQEKKCSVTIIELDKEGYNIAKDYAVDGFCGSIEEKGWEEYLSGKEYDYVLFVDVLEHLVNPLDILKRMEKFLKRDGSILISVPNIAHNSIIIQLLNNQLLYQSTGILDYSHLHYFTYNELHKMCTEAGYSPVYIDATYIAVGKNEFDICYSDIDDKIAELLANRPMGEVYQHLLEVKKTRYVDSEQIVCDCRLGENREYQKVEVENVKGEEFEPNKEFASNVEIERLALEINDLYNAIDDLRTKKDLEDKVFELQIENRSKGKHLHKLDEEIIHIGELLSKAQDDIEERNNHIHKLDEEIYEKNLSICALEYEKIKNKQLIEEQKDKEAKLDEQLKTVSLQLVDEKKKTVELEKQFEVAKLQLVDEKKKTVELKKQFEVATLQLVDEKKKIVELECKLQEIEQTLGREKNRFVELEGQLEELSLQLKERQAEKVELERKNNELQSRLMDSQQIIRNKEGHINILLDVERAYERDKKRPMYIISLWPRRVIDFIVPPHSKRLFFARVIKNIICHPIKSSKTVTLKNIKNYFHFIKTDDITAIENRYKEILEIESVSEIKPMEVVIEPTRESESEKDTYSADEYERLEVPFFNYVKVSIVIPVYNQFDYTYKCIKSIINNSGNCLYEIIVADDCSTDLTTKIENLITNIKHIKTSQNMRFLLNCNNAAKYASGEYILFLNNDTQVQSNWLQPLIDLIESDDKIGMVGSKLVYPDGLLQEAGGILWRDGSAWNYGNRKSPEDPEYNYVKEVDYISGAAIMIKKSLWDEIGGFDERYVPAYYEDTDLAFEVRKHGYKVMFQPLSVVVHFEGVSNGTDVSTGVKHYQEVNAKNFYEKWRDVLIRHEENGQNVFKAKDRSINKKHILVVDHYVPHYDQDAGGKCTYMYLKLFVKMGMKVTFIGDNFFKHEPYTTELNQMGIEVLYGNYYYNNWQDWLKENAKMFDYIYLQRPHISIKYIDIVRENSDAKILYFAHDLHHIREMREYEITGDGEKLESSKKWKEIEYDLFTKADVGHVVGSYEQNIMQKAFPNKPIRNIPLYIYENVLSDINKDFKKRVDLMYVGGFGHHPNVDAVLWFAKEVFPKVVSKYPNIKWHVVGSKAPQEILDLQSPNIIIEGFLSDEELEALYRKCRLDIVPLRYGAGVKGKVVEAAYYQIPLITTSIGAEGIDSDIGSMIVEDDANNMAEMINELYEDYEKLELMSNKGIDFIERYFMISEAERVIKLDVDVEV